MTMTWCKTHNKPFDTKCVKECFNQKTNMKQFKAEWQSSQEMKYIKVLVNEKTIDHIITQYNALCDWIEKRLGEKQTNSYTCVGEGCFPNSMVPSEGTIKIGTITLPKPEWWLALNISTRERITYKLALADASKALGVEIKLTE